MLCYNIYVYANNLSFYGQISLTSFQLEISALFFFIVLQKKDN